MNRLHGLNPDWRIGKVVPINLKRRQDKLCAFHGAMQSWGTPPEKIEPFEAHDASDYETSFDVRDAAIQQFPFWRKLSDDWFRTAYIGKGSLCCLWSMQSVLQEIGRGKPGSLSLMMTDHYCIRRLWWDLDKDLRLFPDFGIFQMSHWHNETNANRPKHFPTPIGLVDDVSKGLAGAGDTALLLTPRGANMILNWSSGKPWHLIEILLHEISYDNPPSCLSSILPNNWASGPIVLDMVTGGPNSERLRGDSE